MIRMTDGEQEYKGRSLIAIYRQLRSMLSVGGARTIVVAESWNDHYPAPGRMIRCSLYSGESRIEDASGRVIYRS